MFTNIYKSFLFLYFTFYILKEFFEEKKSQSSSSGTEEKKIRFIEVLSDSLNAVGIYTNDRPFLL